MLNEEKFITHDFKLPNHHNELCKADEIIDKLKNKFKKIEKTKTINGKNHDELYNEIVRILDYVGRLSMPAFVIAEGTDQERCLQFNITQKRINNRILQRLVNGKPRIRRQRYLIQKGDIIWVGKKKYISGGISDKGRAVRIKGTNNDIRVKDITKVYHVGSLFYN